MLHHVAITNTRRCVAVVVLLDVGKDIPHRRTVKDMIIWNR